MIARGYNAWSCDLLPSEGHNVHRHFQTDIRNLVDNRVMQDRGFRWQGKVYWTSYWNMLIAFPSCRYLTVSGAQWFYHPDDKDLPIEERRPHPKYPDRKEKQIESLDFVRMLMLAEIGYIAVENPVGRISTAIRKPDQIIQPYEYGHDASKRTCLWLKNLPKLQPTEFIEPRIIEEGKYAGAKRWSNQAPCGAEKTSPSTDRWMKRSRTFPGIGEAMANQWPHGPRHDFNLKGD